MTCCECGEPADSVCGSDFVPVWPDVVPWSIKVDADDMSGRGDRSTCVHRECQRVADAKDNNGYGTGLKW